MLVIATEVCPWYESIISVEDDSVKNSILNLNIADSKKFTILRNYHVTGIETNYVPESMSNSIGLIKQENMKTALHLDYSTIALTRSCHITRNLDLEQGSCEDQCDQVYKVTMDKIFNIVYGQDMISQSPDETATGWKQYIEPEEEVKEQLVFYLLGNQIFIKGYLPSFSEKDLPEVDTVVLEKRFYSKEEIYNAIQLLKGTHNG
jgi:hypothetical protein